MKKYYYVCPRCGRTWRYFLPRKKTKCKFCSEKWRTRGAKGTYSRFSATAILIWLALATIVALGVVELTTDGSVSKFVKSCVPAEKKEQPKRPPRKPIQEDVSTVPVVPENEVEEVEVDKTKKSDPGDLDFRSEKTRKKYALDQKDSKSNVGSDDKTSGGEPTGETGGEPVVEPIGE